MTSTMESPPVHRPVFVMGTGRCGLSPVADLLTAHPDLAWPSQYHKVLPGVARVAAAGRFVNHPAVAPYRLRRLVPRHDEAYPFWDRAFAGFAEPDRDLLSSDVTPHIRARVQSAVATLTRHQRRPRFLAEYSGWSRMGFLKEIFPDAVFVHVVRDGRAVANSLLHVDYWRGYNGVHRWQFGLPTDDERAELASYGDSFLARAALNWRRLIRNIVEAGATLDAADLLTIRYEDFVRAPADVAMDALRFAGLDTDVPGLRRAMNHVRIVDANTTKLRIPSWRANMTPEQVAMLDEMLGPELARFGYLTPTA